MKTILTLLALSLGPFLFSNAVSAQAQGDTQIGVKAGINVASFTGDDAEQITDVLGPLGIETSARLGIAAGLAGRYWLSPQIAVQAEALYSQQGWKLEAEEGDGEGAFELDYIEIPLLLRYGFDLSPTLNGGIYAGPGAGFAINSEITAEDSDETLNASIDFGLNAGIQIGSGPFYVDGRFTYGLTNPYSEQDEPGFEGIEDADIANQKFQITLGYWFK